MRIPHQHLQPHTLRALIEEFVSREGTEYGEREVALDDKVAAVGALLERGGAFIVYDADNQTCSIVPEELARQVAPQSVDDGA